MTIWSSVTCQSTYRESDNKGRARPVHMMSTTLKRKAAEETLDTHYDQSRAQGQTQALEKTEAVSSLDPFENATETELSEEGEREHDGKQMDEGHVEELEAFRASFRGLSRRFRLISRIGEGTFSTVYKAEDMLYNSYNLEAKENKMDNPPAKRAKTDGGSTTHHALDRQTRKRKSPRFVAIKKIYVTSSPSRIQNELELLYDLRGCIDVCPLITAFRHQDQVIVVLPFFRHYDFREYFRDMVACDIRDYFRSLFEALAEVHRHGIVHRDIKPTNFLYDIRKKRGVLVDFGLAERDGTDCTPCLCCETSEVRKRRIESSQAAHQPQATGCPKDDTRPSRRANRAGTRGFRAPEVLFKCTRQTASLDIWSAGVILLTILARRFPFFNSADDVEALIELATIFGRRKMRAAALLHGVVFETTIPTVGERGFGFDKLVLWSTGKWKKGPDGADEKLWPGEAMAIQLLQRCLELDPKRRISAEAALDHDFLNPSPETEVEEQAEREAWPIYSFSPETTPAPFPPAQGPYQARTAGELIS